MKRIRTKKGIALLAAVAVVAISAVGAYAYWTSNGGGSGTTSVEKLTTGQWTISATITPSANGLYPGGDATISGTVKNNSDAPLKLHDVVIDPTTAGNATGVVVDDAHAANCAAAGNFAVTSLGLTPGPDQEVAAGDTATFAGTLHMEDTSSNQDGCKNAGLTVDLMVDNGSL